MCVIWGIPYLMIRVAVRELTPATLVFARTALGAVLLVPAAAWRHELRPLLRVWWPLLVYTVIEIGVPWLLLARAETEAHELADRLALAAVPLVGAVLVRMTGDRERMGSSTLVRPVRRPARRRGARRARPRQRRPPCPVAEVGTVAVCYAIGPIILARSLADAPALGVVAASLGITAVVLRADRDHARTGLAGRA